MIFLEYFISASQQAFLRFNGKLTLKAESVLIYMEMFPSLFRKLCNFNLKNGIELRTKLSKTVHERQIGKEKNEPTLRINMR